MKSNLWTLIAAIGVIGITIFATQPKTSRSNPAPAAASQPTGSAPPGAVSSLSPVFPRSPVSPVLPPHLNAGPTPSTPATPTLPPEPTSTPAPAVHIVESGDTPYSIANRYGVPVEYLMVLNNIVDPTRLQLGQELRIPAVSETGEISIMLPYQIQSGDTLFALANRYGSTVEDILTANPGLEPSLLQVDQTIMISITRPEQLLSALAVISTAAPAVNSQPSGPPPANVYDLSSAMVDAVNSQRQNEGLPSLKTNQQLTTAAVAHAQDMVSRGYFGHVTPTGKTLRDRLGEQNLQPDWVGENIQRNVHPLAETVPTAMGWFMGSAPHRNNILHTHYTHIGVGAVEGPPGWYTFVLVFAQL